MKQNNNNVYWQIFHTYSGQMQIQYVGPVIGVDREESCKYWLLLETDNKLSYFVTEISFAISQLQTPKRIVSSFHNVLSAWHSLYMNIRMLCLNSIWTYQLIYTFSKPNRHTTTFERIKLLVQKRPKVAIFLFPSYPWVGRNGN